MTTVAMLLPHTHWTFTTHPHIHHKCSKRPDVLFFSFIHIIIMYHCEHTVATRSPHIHYSSTTHLHRCNQFTGFHTRSAHIHTRSSHAHELLITISQTLTTCQSDVHHKFINFQNACPTVYNFTATDLTRAARGMSVTGSHEHSQRVHHELAHARHQSTHLPPGCTL